MNESKKTLDEFKDLTIEEQFHDWYHEGMSMSDVAKKTSAMYEDYCSWKEAKQKAFGESFKKLEESD
ncbi:hypothetical protein OAJ81_02610 [Gammaproteobacteria bacterium]|jgi:hypothetical protein|nr:hypothetical protein [Gammaproteobacteria bacterium]|tara:strand:- start:146 stop:346 length:201 start_codon:yes stop_codon:yes gene_type:complete